MFNLIHGDCLILMQSMPNESVDCILTDPPYGILDHKIEQNINIPEFFRECERVLKANSFIAFFGRQPTLTTWNNEANKLFRWKEEVIWYKRQRSSPLGEIGRVFENISILTKGKRRFNLVLRPYTDVIESMPEFYNYSSLKSRVGQLRYFFKSKENFKEGVEFLQNDDLSKFYTNTEKRNEFVACSRELKATSRQLSHLKNLVNGKPPVNLVSFAPHNKQKYDSTGNGEGENNIKHPTVKPIQLMEYLIELMTNEGELVLDPFMGSGTTGIACKNTGRRFIGIELDRGYFNIAQDRILGESVSDEDKTTQTQQDETVNTPVRAKQFRLF